jgi:hypothetical protein
VCFYRQHYQSRRSVDGENILLGDLHGDSASNGTEAESFVLDRGWDRGMHVYCCYSWVYGPLLSN